jgi:hypothetical protein
MQGAALRVSHFGRLSGLNGRTEVGSGFWVRIGRSKSEGHFQATVPVSGKRKELQDVSVSGSVKIQSGLVSLWASTGIGCARTKQIDPQSQNQFGTAPAAMRTAVQVT